MRRLCHHLSFIILPAMISVSANAFSLRDAPPYLSFGSESSPYNEFCDEYPVESRKHVICKSYPDKDVTPVVKLPTARELKPDTLYLVGEDSEIEAPYALPPGAGILPAPHKTDNLALTPSGTGADDDCALCVMKFAEGTKVAGLTVDLSTSSWNPTPGSGAERAIFYGATAESEFSESIVFGRNDFVDVVHQLQTVSDNKMQSYHRLKLYAEGSQHLLRVENTSSSAVKAPDNGTWHVDIVNCVGTLSGTIPPTIKEQGGFVITNLAATILSSSVFYTPLDTSHTFPRYGLIANDTPVLHVYRVSHKVTCKDYNPEQDVEEIFRNSLQSDMQIFSDDNSYFPEGGHYVNELRVPSQLVYFLGNNEEYVSIDVDTSPENIDRLTRKGGFFLGNAMQLESICPVIPNDYNATDPLPAVNGLQIFTGPANATVKNFHEFCTNNARNTACKHKTRDRLIDGSIGFAAGVVAATLPWMAVTGCLLYKFKHRAGYIELKAESS